jgi:hypothetical protein
MLMGVEDVDGHDGSSMVVSFAPSVPAVVRD